MSKILVVNGNSYGSAVQGLGELISDSNVLFKDPKSISLVLFTGGADVTPEYYGHTSPKGICDNDKHRDDEEITIFKKARDFGIRTIGICRGIQFINTMAGGTMFHHVEHHAGSRHEMETSLGEIIEVNSLHHQMVIPPKNASIIGWSKKRLSDNYFGDKDLKVEPPEKETESVLFPNIESAGAQYHPEMMDFDSEGAKWFFNLAKDLIEINNFDDIIKKYKGKVCTDKSMQALQ